MRDISLQIASATGMPSAIARYGPNTTSISQCFFYMTNAHIGSSFGHLHLSLCMHEMCVPITIVHNLMFLTLPMSIFTYHPNHKIYHYFQGNTTAIARVGNNGVADEGYSFPLQECQGDCDNNGGKIELSFLFYPLIVIVYSRPHQRCTNKNLHTDIVVV